MGTTREFTGILYEGARRPDYQEELIALLKEPMSPMALKKKLSDYHENDIAAVFDRISPEDRAKIYRVTDAATLSDIFEYLEDAKPYFNELNIKKKVEIISAMEADEAAELLKSLDKGDRNLLVDLIDDEAKRDIAMIESFDDDEIGSRMTMNFIEVSAVISIKEAMEELLSQAADNDNISTIYVTDETHTFYGAADLKDLILARAEGSVLDITATSYPYVYAREEIGDCIERLKSYSEDSIPVLDDADRLLGVLTSQEIVEVVDEELGEDYAKLAGLSAEEDLKEPVTESMKKRLPWLVVLLGLGLVVSGVVGLFEAVVAELTIVVCFQSLILDMAGNAGTQSLAVTIRVLMDESLTARQKAGLVAKECRVGAADGLILGLSSCLVIGLYIWLFRSGSPSFAFLVSACIGIALLVAMIVSSLMGTIIPLAFKQAGVDPAVASGPLITTVNDLVAVVTYYGLAWLLLIRMAGV